MVSAQQIAKPVQPMKPTPGDRSAHMQGLCVDQLQVVGLWTVLGRSKPPVAFVALKNKKSPLKRAFEVVQHQE